MNARMNELAEQATTIEYGMDNGFDRVTFDKAKFAKLIVRECIMAMYEDDGATHHEELLKQHFGVTE